MPKRKLKDSTQVNGELPPLPEPSPKPTSTATIRKPRTMEELLGTEVGTSKYRFLKDPFDTDEYKGYLKKLLDSDFRTHAENFGLKYYDPADRARVERQLTEDFMSHAAKYRAPRNLHPSNKKIAPSVISEIQKIMAGGR